MNANFNDLSSKEHLNQARYLLISAAICSPVFYFFMKNIELQSEDNLFFRILITALSLIGFLASFIKTKHQARIIVFASMMVRVLYLTLYLYLLHINQWTMYQRWSYFVLAFIVCGSTFNLKEYLVITSLSFISPIVLGFFSSSISLIELVHFNVAMFVTLFIIGVSIYAQYRFKKEIYKLTNELVSKTQLAALGEVTAGISHEMNSPIMVVSTSLHQLKRQLSQEDLNQIDRNKVNDLIQKMNRMIDRMTIIANALKIYSPENKKDHFEKVEIISMLEKTIQSYSKINLETGVKISLINPLSPIYCNVDKAQIDQCIVNLIDNGIEACRDQKNPQITISISSQDTFVYISIKDNGKGISEEIMNKIMQPFFTTKEIGSGMGLGLSVALGVARSHNGDLFLDDSSSLTTFVLKLPINS